MLLSALAPHRAAAAPANRPELRAGGRCPGKRGKRRRNGARGPPGFRRSPPSYRPGLPGGCVCPLEFRFAPLVLRCCPRLGRTGPPVGAWAPAVGAVSEPVGRAGEPVGATGIAVGRSCPRVGRLGPPEGRCAPSEGAVTEPEGRGGELVGRDRSLYPGIADVVKSLLHRKDVVLPFPRRCAMVRNIDAFDDLPCFHAHQ